MNGVILMRALRWFVNINRRWCHAFRNRLAFLFDTRSYLDDLRNLIKNDIAQLRSQTIVEVGGIDRPLLEKDRSFRYVGVDIEEKKNCHVVYDEFVVQSIENPLPIKADMVISRALMEHVENNKDAVANMYAALMPGGKSIHYVPSKWHPYSVCLRLVGSTIQRRLIPVLRPGAEAVTGYPVFFDHCSPQAMSRLFESTGFDCIEVRPYYNANDYFAFFFPFFVFVSGLEWLCKKTGWRFFCSGFIISATRRN